MTGPPPFALVILPAGGAFDDSWALAIQPACEAAGAYAERLDAALTPDAVLQHMQNLIAKADLVIVDTTERYEKIFYAAGYAHALDKQVILLTKTEEEIPFDLRHYPHIIHDGKLPDRRELERRARHLLDAAARGEAPLATPVEISVNKVALSPDVPKEVTANDQGNSGLWFDVEIRNQTGWRLRAVRLQLGLIAPSHYREVSGRSGKYLDKIPMDADTRLYLSRQDLTIFPGSWDTAAFHAFKGQSSEARETESFGIRVLTESGYFDFPFTLRWPAAAAEQSS